MQHGITTEIVGRGGTSTIYSCKQRDMVVKRIDFRQNLSFPWLELYIMSTNINHKMGKHITHGDIQLFADGVYIFQERALGDLKIFKGCKLPHQIVYAYMKQIVKGVLELHHLGFIHADLKPSNILLYHSKDDGEVIFKLNDFGDATKYNWYHRPFAGSKKFRPPEMRQEGWNEKVDIWNLGHILYFLLCGEDLFESGEDAELESFLQLGFKEWMKRNRKTICDLKNEKNQYLWELCEQCFEKDIEKRYSMEKLANFFKIPYTCETWNEMNKEEEEKKMNQYLAPYAKDKKDKKRIKSVVKEMIYKERNNLGRNLNVFMEQILCMLRILNEIKREQK